MCDDAVIRLDNRGLKPPEPMIRILEALDRRGPADRVEALLDRHPAFLFPELEARNARFTCEPNEHGGFTLIVAAPSS
jgi:uncharacterized protein (DUF2249 family)